MKITFIGTLLLAFVCLSISFGDTIEGVGVKPRYYYNGNEFEPIKTYDVKDSQGNVHELVMLRELVQFGYSLKWDSVLRQINIVHNSTGDNIEVPEIKKGTQITLSDVRTQLYGLDQIETYLSNGLAFIPIYRLPYVYYDYLPDTWARPFLYALNLEGYYINFQQSFKEKITAEQLSTSIANILEGESNTFRRSYYSTKGLSDFEGLKEAGMFSGVSLTSSSYISREEMAQIGINILDKLQVNYKNFVTEPNPYSDSTKISDRAVNSVNIFYNAGILSLNKHGEIMPLNKVSSQEAAVILAKLLEKFNLITPFRSYSEDRLALSDLKITEDVYEIDSFDKPIVISNIEPKLTLYNAFVKDQNGDLTLVLDQDYAPMGGIYSVLSLNPQITQADVVLKTGEKIRKQMGRMPNYRYIGMGVYRTLLQLQPPVQGINESSATFNLAEIDSIIIYAPRGVKLRLKF